MKTAKCREVRLGLVMYGGVSLAIYINGVAHEFFRAVRGRGVYRLIKALTDSDIIVDVISGTSAGGINGIMLSYALCNEREFSDSATLWRKHGDISKLLRSPHDEANAISLLNSEGFYQPKLEEVFRDMPPGQPEDDEDRSPFSELDLFVTGTDVDGTLSTVFDDAGHPIDVKNHRSVFILSHREGRKEPFKSVAGANPGGSNDVTIQALAKLSRVTSCFPAAFAPVHVSRAAVGDPPADALLQKWGNLGKDAYFLDGGVLDNKPFTYTIKSIFSRCADREVDRKLFYVEPDPECFQEKTSATSPTILQSVLAALIGIPGYESISDDLKLLASRNSKLQQYNRLLAGFTGDGAAPSAESKRLYTRSRLVAISERVLRGVLRVDGRDDLIDPSRRNRAAELVRQFDAMEVSEIVLDQFDISYRIRRIMRLTYLIHDMLSAHGPTDAATVQAEKRRTLWRALNNQFQLYEILRSAMERMIDDAPIDWEKLSADHLWRCVRAALLRLIDEATEPAKFLSDERLEKFFHDQERWLEADSLSAISATLRERAGAIVKEFQTGAFQPDAVTVNATLLQRLDVCERQLIEQFTSKDDPLRKAWDNFANVDTYLFPLELIGDLHEKDIIETIRISPRDATRGFSHAGHSDKVAGDAVYHFGGFFKRSWRSNDIMWGRLDAVCQLVETLLTRERLRQIVSDEGWRGEIRDRFFEKGGNKFQRALDPSRLFPNSGARTAEDIGLWLQDLLSDDPAHRDKALDPTTFDERLSLIVEAAQLEVIDEDLVNVLTDAIGEQAEWNQFKVSEELTPERAKEQMTKAITASPFTFHRSKGMFDPLFACVAAEERARLALKTFEEDEQASGGGATRPTKTRLGQFFTSTYRVGAEELTRDVPPPVLLELLAHALLVTRNCVLKLFPEEKAQRLRRHLLYKLGLKWPLSALYSAAVLSRRAPAWTLTLLAVPVVMSAVALLIAAVWHDPLLWTDGKAQGSRIGFLVVLPLAVLAGECLLLKSMVRRAPE